jgi:hypothetical protein
MRIDANRNRKTGKNLFQFYHPLLSASGDVIQNNNEENTITKISVIEHSILPAGGHEDCNKEP